MAKKILAQIALAIFINILILPVAVGADEPGTPADPEIEQDGAELTSLRTPFTDLKPCVNEYKTDENGNPIKKGEDDFESGPDNGYVITIIEEPLNVETSGSTETKNGKPPDNYVVRACFRNTYQYYDKNDTKFHSVPMLAASCSKNAQTLFENAALKDYQVKYSCKEVMVILTKGGTTAIYGYINLLYRWGAGMVGIIAVTVIILSGIQISASGGDSEAIGSAKKRILQSITGIIVLFLSSLILYTINPNFFTR